MSSSNVLFRKDAVFQKCPDCKTVGHVRISRSHNFIEYWVKKMTCLNIYKCKQCGWRGYKSYMVFTAESFKVLRLYVLAALICGFIVRIFLASFI